MNKRQFNVISRTNIKHTYFQCNTLNYLDNSILCITFPRLVSHSLVKGTTKASQSQCIQRLVSYSVVKVSIVAQYKYTRILRVVY